MEKKKGFNFKVFLAIVAIGIVAFAITMGNYMLALGMTAACLGLTLYWQWPNIMCAKGQSEYAKGNNTKALELLKKAHTSSRARVSNSCAYAYILLRVGEDEEAAKVLNFVLLNQKMKEADRMQARQILSLVRYKQGDFEEATRLMEMVFETYKNSSVYGALGYYKILSNSPDMMKFNLEAYDYNSDDKIIIDNMIILYLKNGDIEKAKELSDKSVDAGNKGVEIFYHAGQVYLALGDKKKALDYFKKAKSCQRSFMTTVSEGEIDREIEALEQE